MAQITTPRVTIDVTDGGAYLEVGGHTLDLTLTGQTLDDPAAAAANYAALIEVLAELADQIPVALAQAETQRREALAEVPCPECRGDGIDANCPDELYDSFVHAAPTCLLCDGTGKAHPLLAEQVQAEERAARAARLQGAA